MVVGVTGPNAAGKGELGLYLKSKGFVYYSLSDMLREEGRKIGIEPSRENLIRLGNELRRKDGPSVLARRVIEKISNKQDYIVDSIRNPAEVEALRDRDDFVLIGIDAPIDIRLKRILKRKRSGDPRTLEELIEKEEKENKCLSENQQLKRCLEMADVIIVNDSVIESFHKKIDEAIQRYKKT